MIESKGIAEACAFGVKWVLITLILFVPLGMWKLVELIAGLF